MSYEVINEVLESVIVTDQQGPPGQRGIPGEPGNYTPPIAFAYGDATPAVLLTIPAAKAVYEVKLYIDQAFDGVGAQLTIGTAVAPELIMASNENDPSLVATFSVNLGIEFGVDTPLFLFITPGAGASQGSGQVVFTIQG